MLTTLLNGFLSVMQVLLIKGVTFGLSPFIFALGDDVFADFIAGIQFLVSQLLITSNNTYSRVLSSNLALFFGCSLR